MLFQVVFESKSLSPNLTKPNFFKIEPLLNKGQLTKVMSCQ